MDLARETAEIQNPPWITAPNDGVSTVTLEPFGNGDNPSSREKAVLKIIETRFQESCPKCKNTQFYTYKCQTCKNSWYSAITKDGTGAVHGFFNGKVDSLAATNYYKSSTLKFSKLDILLYIPSDKETELQEFFTSLRNALETMQKSPLGSNLSIRLLLTRFGSNSMSDDDLQTQISKQTKLEKDKVILHYNTDEQHLSSPDRQYQHPSTCTEADCLVAMVNVGLAISPSFFYSAHEFVQSGRSGYHPIAWSEFDPELVQLELEYYSHQGLKLRDLYDHHRGVWANTTHPAYVMSGADWKQRFKGSAVGEKDGRGLNIVRMPEYGLVQRFSPKDQTLSSLPKMGKYLKDLSLQNETAFLSMIGRNQYKGDVFLAVVTSRKNLESRVVAIRESWGQRNNLRSNVHVRYFVGNGTEAKNELLRLGGIDNPEELIVMPEVVDDEYPPVRKNVNMLKTINRMIQKQEGSIRDVGYIMKVDDDSYVNFDGLLKFLAYHDNSSQAFQFWGERGFGRKKDREGIQSAGLRKAYCLGGPGYIMSKQALEAASRGFDGCVNEISVSPHREAVWHSDVVISICIANATDVGCFDNEEDYQRNRVFASNYFGDENFVHKDDLHRVVSMHPFKKGGQMQRQHSRFPRRIASGIPSGVTRKDVVTISDQVYQNINILMPFTPFEGKRQGNSWTLLLLLVLSIGFGVRRKRKVRRHF